MQYLFLRINTGFPPQWCRRQNCALQISRGQFSVVSSLGAGEQVFREWEVIRAASSGTAPRTRSCTRGGSNESSTTATRSLRRVVPMAFVQYRVNCLPELCRESSRRQPSRHQPLSLMTTNKQGIVLIGIRFERAVTRRFIPAACCSSPSEPPRAPITRARRTAQHSKG